MISEHLKTLEVAIGTITAVTRRSGRIVSAPPAAMTDYAIRERKAEEAKKKKRRDSNVQRGEDAVRIHLESDENAKKSGETSKTYKN